MRPIPEKIKKELNNDPFYEKCCLCGRTDIQWHHAVIYRGRQINEKWAIVPACLSCHDEKLPELELLAISRASETDLQKYNKRNWEQRINYLNDLIFGNE